MIWIKDRPKLDKVLLVADDVRMLFKEASGLPISDTVKDLGKLLGNKIQWGLCGGLAVGVYARPRGTDDVDIVLSNESVLTYVYALLSPSFRRAQDHLMVHKRTGVAVDLVTPEFVKIDPEIVTQALATTNKESYGEISIPVVSKEGLVAMKLNRGKYLDLADIESIVKAGGNLDMSKFPLTENQRKVLEKIQNDVSNEKGQ